MKVFQLNDYEWWVGETLIDCVNEREVEYGSIYIDDPHELTKEQMKKYIFNDVDENEKLGRSRQFRTQLRNEIKLGGKFPRLFACSED